MEMAAESSQTFLLRAVLALGILGKAATDFVFSYALQTFRKNLRADEIVI